MNQNPIRKLSQVYIIIEHDAPPLVDLLGGGRWVGDSSGKSRYR